MATSSANRNASPPPPDDEAVERGVSMILYTSLTNQSPSEAAAKSIASQLDALYLAHSSPSAVEGFLWTFWDALIDGAMKFPASSPQQALLVQAISQLRTLGDDEADLPGEEARIWTHLPLFAPCLREAWNYGAIFSGPPQDQDISPDTTREWLSLNSFAAQLIGKDLLSTNNLAIWELRTALEENAQTNPALTQMRLEVVREWISHAGTQLHALCVKDTAPDNDESSSSTSLRPGTLFAHGCSGFNLARWRFWQSSLAEKAALVHDPEVRERISQTAAGMTQC